MINGFQGDSSTSRSYPIPKPTLERDFQMSVQLNPKISVGPGIWGQRNWISYISGHWNGRWGKGTVVVSRRCHWSRGFPPRTAAEALIYFSRVVKTPSWSLQIYPPILTPTTFYRLMITHLPLFPSKPMAGESAPARPWKSLKILLRRMRLIQSPTPSGSTFTWKPVTLDICTWTRACGLAAGSVGELKVHTVCFACAVRLGIQTSWLFM